MDSIIHKRLAALGVEIPEILLPRMETDFSKWAVIACDQFTQNRDYWERVKNAAADSPTCLNLIFPEVYLETAHEKNRKEEAKKQRIQDIRNSMRSYINNGVFSPSRRCCVYLERSTPRHPRRRGLVLALDLEQYDWNPQKRPLIRATEETIKDRLPPRMEIRRGAPLELPHIILLIDDEKDTLIPSLGELARKNTPLYETSLMMGSGSVSGWALDSEEAGILLADGLEALAERARNLYGGAAAGECPFLFAVGDGNHSLATAKAVWEEYKKDHAGEADLENHPARRALVEVENLYDPGIAFEPIHRIIFGIDGKEILDSLSGLTDIQCSGEMRNRIIRIKSAGPDIATAAIQPLLDRIVKEQSLSIDYIHGEDDILNLVSHPQRQAVGLILPPIQKDGLFKTVDQTGPLPRKSFSMGDAEEKRFYMECRKLFD